MTKKPTEEMIQRILGEHNLLLEDLEQLFRPWILTVDELADQLKISSSKIYQLENSKQIVSYRPGGIRFDWDRHIVPFLASTEKKNPSTQRLTGKKATLKHLDLS